MVLWCRPSQKKHGEQEPIKCILSSLRNIQNKGSIKQVQYTEGRVISFAFIFAGSCFSQFVQTPRGCLIFRVTSQILPKSIFKLFSHSMVHKVPIPRLFWDYRNAYWKAFQKSDYSEDHSKSFLPMISQESQNSLQGIQNLTLFFSFHRSYPYIVPHYFRLSELFISNL